MTLPYLTKARAPLTSEIDAVNEFGEQQKVSIPAERALTVYVDKRELVTLMTLGANPELLVLGYLRNQRLVRDVADIESITVDWDVGAAAVKTRHGIEDIEEKTAHRVVTTGCGQGSVFGGLMDEVDQIALPEEAAITQSQLYSLVNTIRLKETTYKSAGSVHACALFSTASGESDMLLFVEDVGRHNAIDTIAGWMWMNEAPTLPTPCGSLPPEGALRLQPGKAGSAALAGAETQNSPALAVSDSAEGALRLQPGKAGSAALAGAETQNSPALAVSDPAEGALRLRPGKAGSAALAGAETQNSPALAVSDPAEGALRLQPGKAGSAALAGAEADDSAAHAVSDAAASTASGLVFYTTGRLTSEMVIKSAQMGVPVVVSRSGITQMGHQVAQLVGLCAIGRATNKRFLCYTHAERLRLEPGLLVAASVSAGAG